MTKWTDEYGRQCEMDEHGRILVEGRQMLPSLIEKEGPKMADKSRISFDIAELQKVNLGPGDVLSVKLIGDDFDVDTMESLRDSLTKVFTKNKVIIFTMPKDSDIQLTAVSETPASYCSDCSCGKKEASENKGQ